MQSVIKIDGMSCQGCVSSVENALKKMPGVESVKVDLKEGRAVVGHDGAKVSAADLATKISDIGYDAQVTSG